MRKGIKALVALLSVWLIVSVTCFVVDERKAHASRLEAAGVSIGRSIVRNLEMYERANGSYPANIFEAIGDSKNWEAGSWRFVYQPTEDSHGFTLKVFSKGNGVPCFEANRRREQLQLE